MDNRKIGVFDSGLGGLSVVKEMKKYMPEESIVYFGDTARLPYGSKSKESIIRFSKQIMRFLTEHDVKAVIIACGTASSNALEALKECYDLPIIGVVEPGAEAAARNTRNGNVGVLGTAATINSRAFERLIHQCDASVNVISQACPMFVPLVEEGWFEDDVTRQIAARYLAPLKEAGVDTVVLGCTHYPLLKRVIGEEFGDEVKLVNVSKEAVLKMKEYLAANGLQANPEKEGAQADYEFYASDSIDHMREFGERVVGLEGLKVEKINIEKY